MGKKGLLSVAILLSIVLLLVGCGSAKESEGVSAAAEPASEPCAEAVPELPPAPAERVIRPQGSEEILDALRAAWEKGGVAAGECLFPDEAADTMLLSEGLLYSLQKKSFCIRDAGEEIVLLSSVSVGTDWEETDSEDYWGGQEKHPRSFCLHGERAAVLSDFFRYGSRISEDGGWTQEDNTRSALDILDISDPAAPVPMGTLGQSGTLCAALLRGDTLFVVSRRQLFEEDCPGGEPADFLPATYNGEERSPLKAEETDILRGGSGWYTMMTAYDLRQGTLLCRRALLGAGESMRVSEAGVLFPLADGSALCCLFTDTGIEAAKLAGEAEMALFSTEEAETALFADGSAPDALYPWTEDGAMTLTMTEKGVKLSLCERKGGTLKETASLELGYDLRMGCEQGKAVFTDAENGRVIIPAEDGWCIYAVGEEGICYERSLFSYDAAENRRCFPETNRIILMDIRRCFVLDRQSGELIGSWDF